MQIYLSICDIRQMVHYSLPSQVHYVELDVISESDIYKFLPKYVNKNLWYYMQYRMHYLFHPMTKVPEFGSQPESILQPKDDPHSWCLRVQKDWVITNHLQVGKQNNLGVLTQYSPLYLIQGDFVNVAIEIDVALDGTLSQNSVVHVHLSLLHIVLLAKASELP